MFATAESLSPYKHKINISGENRVGRTAGTKEVWSKSCCHPSWFTVAAGFVTTCHHLSHLESCRSWCYWCCWCCPPARCCSWGSLACGASRPMTDFPGRRFRRTNRHINTLVLLVLFNMNNRWIHHEPCRCRSPLWPLSRSPPPRWRSCWRWRRSGRGHDLPGWTESCHRDKNYTAILDFNLYLYSH